MTKGKKIKNQPHFDFSFFQHLPVEYITNEGSAQMLQARLTGRILATVWRENMAKPNWDASDAVRQIFFFFFKG